MTTGPGSSAPQKRTPFFPYHAEHARELYTKSGWVRPARYEATSMTEHLRCRASGGLFDVHSMGRVFVRGTGSTTLLDTVCVSTIADLKVGGARYTCMCSEDGGIVDDLIIYRTNDETYFMITNTVSREAVVALLGRQAGPTVHIEDATSSIAYIAVQGPASREVLAAAGVEHDLSTASLPYFGCAPEVSVRGVPTLLARTGYTGELGYELNFPAEFALDVWDLLCTAGREFEVRPCGGQALMSLRVEKGYRSYGSDIGPDVDVLSAGLGWTVAWDKPGFTGREALAALRETGVPSRMLCVLGLDGTELRPGTVLLDDAGAPIGTVTSGLWGPSVEAYIGLARVASDHETGDDVRVVPAGGVGRARLSPRPFFDPKGLRVRL